MSSIEYGKEIKLSNGKITEVDNTCMKIVSLYIVAEYLLLRAVNVESKSVDTHSTRTRDSTKNVERV